MNNHTAEESYENTVFEPLYDNAPGTETYENQRAQLLDTLDTVETVRPADTVEISWLLDEGRVCEAETLYQELLNHR